MFGKRIALQGFKEGDIEYMVYLKRVGKLKFEDWHDMSLDLIES